MRNVLLCVVAAVLILCMTGDVASAAKEVIVKQLDAIEATPLNLTPLGVLESCQIGNLNPSGYAIGGFMYPPEDYKLAFDPLATCTVCPIGFRVTNVHVFLQTAGACSIVMSVDVEEAEYATPNCPSPGQVWCTSDLYNVEIPQAGLWDIGLPISCDCLTRERMYLLGFHIESATCTPDLITDAGPAVLCANWNDFGAGWSDLLADYPTWPGNLKIFADAECCTPPVPVEDTSWGAIKELYDN